MMTDKIIRTLLFVGFFSLFFSNEQTLAQFALALGVTSLLLAAATALAHSRVKAIRLGWMEWLLLAVGFMSLSVNVLNATDYYSSLISIVFLATTLSIITISRALGIVSVFELLGRAYLIAIICILTTSLSDFVLGLVGQNVVGEGLQRFRPLGLHPNLSGFIFGAGTIVLSQRSRHLSGTMRWIYLIGAATSFAIVLASSARAGLVAAVSAILIVNLIAAKKVRRRRIVTLFIAASSLAVAGFLFRERITGYLVRVLELTSESRGLGSGGTGRVELWHMGIEYLTNSTVMELLLGSGFRSAGPEAIGFSTESSFITILIENGVALGGLFLISLVVAAFASARRVARGESTEKLVSMLLIFALIQSIFNRYLLAIGNPFSVLLLFLYASSFRENFIENKLQRVSSGTRSHVRAASTSVDSYN